MDPSPSSRSVRKMRIAISPRFATRTLSKVLPDMEGRILPFRVPCRSADGRARSLGPDRDRVVRLGLHGSRVLGDRRLLRRDGHGFLRRQARATARSLVGLRVVPAWMVATIVVREVLITGLWQAAIERGVVLAA